MSMGKLKLPLRDSQDEAPAFHCGRCGGEVYPGEPAFQWDKKRLCVDCFRAKVNAWLDNTPTQVAAALGFDYEEVV